MAPMNDRTKAALAAGIASGYVMGRTRKAKLALALATYVVGRRFRLHPMGMAEEGMHKLKDNPQLSQLGGQLLQAGRTAATAAANRRVSSLADALQSRTAALGGDGQRADQGGEGGGDGGEEEPDEEQAEDSADRGDRDERRSARSAARSRKAASAGKARKSGSSGGSSRTDKAAKAERSGTSGARSGPG